MVQISFSVMVAVIRLQKYSSKASRRGMRDGDILIEISRSPVDR
jgi:hypothetical protein